MTRILILFATLLIFPASPAYAIYYREYTTADKLLSNNVYSVFNDSKGYLWFATDQGVCKYDGKSFRHFTAMDGLADNEILGFFEDAQHRLWLSTLNGNGCYIRNDSVFNSQSDPLLKQMPSNISFPNTWCNAGDTTLYIGYITAGICKFAENKATWVYKFNGREYLTMLSYQDGLIYAYTTHNTVIIDNDRVISVKPCSYRYANYANGKLLIADTSGIKMFENGALVWQKNGRDFSGRYVLNMYADRVGNIFCCTQKGLLIFNRHSNKEYRLFLNTKVSSITQDIIGNYWIAAPGKGIIQLHQELENIHLLRSINGGRITYSNRGDLFISEEDTVYAYSLSNNILKQASIQCPITTEPVYINDDYFFYTDADRPVIIDRKTNSTVKIDFRISFKNIWEYDKNKFLIQDAFGIHDCSIANDKITPLNLVNFYTDSHRKYRITNPVFNAKTKTLYFLAVNSLYEYNARTKVKRKIFSFPAESNIVNIQPIDSTLILSTNDHHYFTYANGVVRKRNSIYVATLLRIWDIGDQHYLFRNNKGYYIWHSSKLLHSNSINAVEYPFNNNVLLALYPFGDQTICNVDGNLYLFNTRLLNKKTGNPSLYIDRIVINGKEYNPKQCTLKNTRNCNIELALNTLHYNGLNSFQFRIIKNGEQGEWLKHDGGTLNIMLHAFGAYHIEIRALTENNIVSPVQSITVVLSPPFYNTPAFYCIIAVMLLAGMYYLIHMHHARRRKMLQQELEHIQLEHKAVNSLLNPHFIFNAINNIQNLVNQQSGDTANRYLVKLSRLIRQNIENLQFTVIPLESELNLVSNYIHLQNLRFNNMILYEVRNSIGPIQHIMIPPLLIHTLVENSIVHGFGKNEKALSIVVDLTPAGGDYIKITITDNGVGFHPNFNKKVAHGRKTSTGLNITRKRLERLSAFYKVDHHFTITNRSDTSGTVVSIIIYTKFVDW